METATLSIRESELLTTVKARGAVIDLLGSASERLQQAFDRFSDARFNSAVTVTFKSSSADVARGRVALAFLPRGDPTHIDHIFESESTGISYDSVVRMPGAVSARITSGSTSVTFDPRHRQPTRTQIDDLNTMFLLVATTEPSDLPSIIGELWITYDVTFYDMLPKMVLTHHSTLSVEADPNASNSSMRTTTHTHDIHHPSTDYTVDSDTKLASFGDGMTYWDKDAQTNVAHKCFRVKWDCDRIPKPMELVSDVLNDIAEVIPNQKWPGETVPGEPPHMAPDFQKHGKADLVKTVDKRTLIKPTTKKGELTFWAKLGNGIKSVAGKVAGAISSTVAFLAPHVGKVAKAFFGFRQLQLEPNNVLAIKEAISNRSYDGPSERGLKPEKARSGAPKQSQRSKPPPR